MNIFVFDIETVPDITSGRRLLGLENLPDEAVVAAMQSLQKEANGQTFVKHHLQKIVAISVVFRHKDQVKVWSLGEVDSPEDEIIQRFYAGLEKYVPTLVSWNGSQFDLPVLHYRTLLHGIVAPTYWEMGENNNSFKYNNYLSRYHTRHIDLMDILAAYQQRAFVKLDEMATMLGFPGKMGMDGKQVGEKYFQGQIDKIRQYCETDVLNTYLIFLRFQLMRGILTLDTYQYELELLQSYLKGSPLDHLKAFLNAWQS